MEQNNSETRYTMILYWSVPLLLGIIQSGINIYLEILPWGISLVDGFIYSFLLGAFGMATWFVVRYNSPEEHPFVQLLTTHLAASLVLSLAWVYSAGFITRIVLDDSKYILYQGSHTTIRLVAGFLFYLLMVAVFYLYILYRKNREKADREKELRIEVREAVLRALKSQINPHFLFNSLNSIASLTITDPEKAREMVIALSDFMRYSLRKQQNEMVPLGDEINHTELYLKIEKIRFGSKMTYSFRVEPECIACQIPTLLLQPLFENSIKYGVYEASDPVEISLDARKENNHVVLTLFNTYDPEAATPKGEGIGLKNTRERLRLAYNSNNLINVEDRDGKFSVTIYLPCENREEA